MSTVILLDSKVSTTTVNNTTTETDLFSSTLPAFALEVANRSVRLKLAGEFLNNTGGADTLVIRVKIGTTTLLATVALSLAASANRRKWFLEAEIISTAADTQRARGTLHISDADTDSFSDSGTDGVFAVGYGTGAEVTSNALDFDVTGQLGTASVNLEVTCTMGQLEFLR